MIGIKFNIDKDVSDNSHQILEDELLTFKNDPILIGSDNLNRNTGGTIYVTFNNSSEVIRIILSEKSTFNIKLIIKDQITDFISCKFTHFNYENIKQTSGKLPEISASISYENVYWKKT